jgi:hypothetical protein
VLGWAAYALTEVRKYLIPDSNDEIRQEQMREMELIRQVLLEQKGFTMGLSHKILSRDHRDTKGSKNIDTSIVDSMQQRDNFNSKAASNSRDWQQEK